MDEYSKEELTERVQPIEVFHGDIYERDRFVRLRYEQCIKLLTPYIKMGAKLLDLGCYSADLSRLLPHGVLYLGVEKDQEAIELGRKKGANIIQANVEERLPLDDEFDMVVAMELLEHLKDPVSLLLEIRRLLAPHGVVVMSLPNECTLYHRARFVMGKGVLRDPFAPHYHLHFPTIRQSEDLCRSYFSIIARDYWVHADVGGRLGRMLVSLPTGFWRSLAYLRPSLFARGSIFLCAHKTKDD